MTVPASDGACPLAGPKILYPTRLLPGPAYPLHPADLGVAVTRR